jgi:repressor LexA
MPKLTEREQQILNFIRDFTDEKGYPPTVREIGKAVGLSSSSTVHAYLNRLERKRFLKRGSSMPRAISVNMPKPEVIPVSVIGRIVAGPPVPAVENCEETIILPKSFGGSGNLFALRVRGNSMVEAGIFENDIVVVRWQPTAENGDIVVALIDNEATIKRFFKENGCFRLQPENRALQPIVTDRATILGKVVSLLRKY